MGRSWGDAWLQIPPSSGNPPKILGTQCILSFVPEDLIVDFYTLFHYGLNLKDIKHFEYLSEEIKCSLMQKTTDVQSSSGLSPER